MWPQAVLVGSTVTDRVRMDRNPYQRIAMVLSLPVFVCAQWLDWPTQWIPRTPNGKPNLVAPAPKTPEGKPDLAGLWRPETNPYYYDVIQDLKDETIFQPAAEAIFLK